MRSKSNYLHNPQTIDSIIPFASYNTHKFERKKIQNQRQHAQHATSFLERQAKKSLQQLQSKQQSLINFYKLRQSRFQQMQKKEQHRQKVEKELQQLRKTNTSFRQYNLTRRTAVRKEWENTNKKAAKHIKSIHSDSQSKLSEERELQKSLLKKRNEAFSKAMMLGNQHSRIRSLHQKKLISSQVKNDLIYVQQSIKSRQLARITNLNQRQQHLLEIVRKTKKEQHVYDHTLSEVQGLPFEQIYPKIKTIRCKESYSHKSSRSDSIM